MHCFVSTPTACLPLYALLLPALAYVYHWDFSLGATPTASMKHILFLSHNYCLTAPFFCCCFLDGSQLLKLGIFQELVFCDNFCCAHFGHDPVLGKNFTHPFFFFSDNRFIVVFLLAHIIVFNHQGIFQQKLFTSFPCMNPRIRYRGGGGVLNREISVNRPPQCTENWVGVGLLHEGR